MRYRIFANGFLYYFEDRQSFDESLLGKDPNNPVGGVLNVLGQDYVVTNYREYASTKEEEAENEFHEIVQDWFADVEVKVILS